MASIKRPAKVAGKRVAIIGGGPTGIAAAYFCGRAGIETTIFERESCLGGVPRHVIPAFRIANEVIEKDIALMEQYGVEVKCGAPAPSVDELKKMGYTHILLAVGAWKPGKLDIAGDVAGAIQRMKGVKAGNIGVAGNIAVIGGGNTAIDSARTAVRLGAKEVVITHNTEVLAYAGEKVYTCPIKARNLSGRTGRGDTTFAGYIAERQRGSVEEALNFCTALVSLKMETPGPFKGTREDVLAYMKEFY